jgi:hypothetical protein
MADRIYKGATVKVTGGNVLVGQTGKVVSDGGFKVDVLFDGYEKARPMDTTRLTVLKQGTKPPLHTPKINPKPLSHDYLKRKGQELRQEYAGYHKIKVVDADRAAKQRKRKADNYQIMLHKVKAALTQLHTQYPTLEAMRQEDARDHEDQERFIQAYRRRQDQAFWR